MAIDTLVNATEVLAISDNSSEPQKAEVTGILHGRKVSAQTPMLEALLKTHLGDSLNGTPLPIEVLKIVEDYSLPSEEILLLFGKCVFIHCLQQGAQREVSESVARFSHLFQAVDLGETDFVITWNESNNLPVQVTRFFADRRRGDIFEKIIASAITNYFPALSNLVMPFHVAAHITTKCCHSLDTTKIKKLQKYLPNHQKLVIQDSPQCEHVREYHRLRKYRWRFDLSAGVLKFIHYHPAKREIYSSYAEWPEVSSLL